MFLFLFIGKTNIEDCLMKILSKERRKRMSNNKGKGKVFATLQKIGKSLMLPVSVLPAAGILLRIGQDDLLGRYGVIFKNLATAGDAIFTNLPLIFAVGVAIGFSGGEAVASLAAVIGQLILQAVLLEMGKRRSEEHTSELQSRQYLVCRL